MADLEPAPNGYPIKLVRDKTPNVINKTGQPGELFYRRLPLDKDDDKDEYLKWLKKKLHEEVGEYLLEGSDDELKDIVSVLDALSVIHGYFSFEDLVHDTNNHPRGGFFEGIMMYGLHPEFDKGD